MTQDQHGRGSVVRGEVVPDDEAAQSQDERPEDERPRPMTRFQKVASALRGDTHQDQATDQDAADAGAEAPRRDYWDDEQSAAGSEEAVAVTQPDALGARSADHPADAEERTPTQPDMFGTTARPDPGETTAADQAQARDEASGEAAGEVPGEAAGEASGEAAGEVPGEAAGEASGEGAGLASGEASGEAAGGAAGGAAGEARPGEVPGELRPGEATDALGDFGDIAYGNLIPEAAEFREQWQQIQYRFVDDPHGSVTEAADVISQVTARLEAAIAERQRAIEERQRAIAERQRALRGRWGEGTDADTETLRETLRMYRGFLDQLLGSRAGPG